MNRIQILEPFVSWLLQTSWQASLLALVVLLLQRIFRHRLDARWVYALWGLVLIRLLAPSLPESPSSVYHFTSMPSSPSAWIESAPPTALQIQIEAIIPPAPRLSLLGALSFCWLVGALTVAAVSLGLHLCLAEKLGRSRPLRDPQLGALLLSCARELKLKHTPRAVLFPFLNSPAVIGLWRPCLLLPPDLPSRFSQAELRFILLHEMAHLKRGDLLIQWLLTLLQIFHWFNPVLWFAFNRIRQDREAATDALVLARAGETSRRDYGNTLLKVLGQFDRRNSLTGMVGILETKGSIQNRILHICRFNHRAYRWSLLGACLIGMAGLVFLTNPKPKTEPRPPVPGGQFLSGANPAEFPHENNSGVISAKFEATPAKEALLALREKASQAGVSFEFSGLDNLPPNSRITADLENYPVGKALRAVSYLGQFGLNWDKERSSYSIVPLNGENSPLVRIETRFIEVPVDQFRSDGIGNLEKAFSAEGLPMLEKISDASLVAAPSVIAPLRATASIEVGETQLQVSVTGQGSDLKVNTRLLRRSMNSQKQEMIEEAIGTWSQKTGEQVLLRSTFKKEEKNRLFYIFPLVTVTLTDRQKNDGLLPSRPANRTITLKTIPARNAVKSVEVLAQIIELPLSNFSTSEMASYKSAVDRNDIVALAKIKGANIMSCPSVSLAEPQPKAIIEVVRDLRFPSSVEKTPGFPMTPAKFDTISVGVKIQVSARSQPEGIMLSGKLEIRDLEGMTQGDDNIGAAFSTKEGRFNTILQDKIPRIVNRFPSSEKQIVTTDGKNSDLWVEKETILVMTARKISL